MQNISLSISSAAPEGVMFPAAGVEVGNTTPRSSSRKSRHSSPQQEGVGVVVGAVHAGGGIGGGGREGGVEEDGSTTKKETKEGTETTEGETDNISSSSYDAESNSDVPPPTAEVERAISGLTDADYDEPSPSLYFGSQGLHSVREGENQAVAVKAEENDAFFASLGRRNIAIAVEYDTNLKQPSHKNRRFRLYAFFAFAILVAIILGVTVGVVLSKPAEETEEPPSYRESLGIEAKIKTVVCNDLLRDPNSPFSKALEWITFDDPMQLLPSASNFIQRYTAAYFYFDTSENGAARWRSCNPIEKAWDSSSSSSDTLCMFKSSSFAALEQLNDHYGEVPSNVWLSNTSECGWGGLRCDEHDQVRVARFPGSNLTGTFPEGIFNWPFLQAIVFSSNNLRGPLPAKLTEMLKHLVTINLGFNQFTGPIPDEWWSASNLHVLDVGDNRITGTLSKEIGNLHDLKSVMLENNQFRGTIPMEIGLINGISQFDMSRNRLEGEIPSTIENWKGAIDIRLYQNKLVGPIPQAIGALTTLWHLHLHHNALTGQLPDALYDLTNMVELTLNDCGFTGTLSPKIGKLGKSLESLRLSTNKLYGLIPTDLAQLTRIQSLWLQDNAFTGSVPEEVCSLRNQNRNGDLQDVLYMVLEEFKADCSADDAGYVELQCTCCSECCNPNGAHCLPTTSGA